MSRFVQLKDGTELWIHDDGEALSDHIVRERDFFERDILDYIRDNYNIHDCIVDVGANIGNHTAYFAKYLDYQTIVAIEPVPDNFALLRKNTESEGSIVLRHGAAGNSFQSIRMAINRGNMGACEVTPSGELLVPQLRLDELMIDPVTLIKIDVEWYEPQVLEGAKNLIAEDKPLILIEDASDEYRQFIPDYYQLLKSWVEHKTYLYGVLHHRA